MSYTSPLWWLVIMRLRKKQFFTFVSKSFWMSTSWMRLTLCSFHISPVTSHLVEQSLEQVSRDVSVFGVCTSDWSATAVLKTSPPAETGTSLIGDDELVTAPVLITPIRKVPADDDGDFSASVGRGGRNVSGFDDNELLIWSTYLYLWGIYTKKTWLTSALSLLFVKDLFLLPAPPWLEHTSCRKQNQHFRHINCHA